MTGQTPPRPSGATVASFWLLVVLALVLTTIWMIVVPWPWNILFALLGIAVAAYSLVMALAMTEYWISRR